MSCRSRSPQSPEAWRRRPSVTATVSSRRAALAVMTIVPSGNVAALMAMMVLAVMWIPFSWLEVAFPDQAADVEGVDGRPQVRLVAVASVRVGPEGHVAL